METSTFGERLAYLRNKHNLSQVKLGEMLDGYNRDHIASLENNKTKSPKSGLVSQLVNIFQTSYEFLLHGEGLENTLEFNEEQPALDKYPLLDLIDRLSANSELEKGNIELIKSEIVLLVEGIERERKRAEKFREQLMIAMDEVDQLRKELDQAH